MTSKFFFSVNKLVILLVCRFLDAFLDLANADEAESAFLCLYEVCVQKKYLNFYLVVYANGGVSFLSLRVIDT